MSEKLKKGRFATITRKDKLNQFKVLERSKVNKEDESAAKRERRVLKILLDRGIDPTFASGLVGNAKNEGGKALNPKSKQRRGPAIGIFQFEGKRKSDLLKRDEPDTIDTQTNFILDEMEGKVGTEKNFTKRARRDFKRKGSTPESAAAAIEHHLIRPGRPTPSKRKKSAREVFDRNFAPAEDLTVPRGDSVMPSRGRFPASVEPDFIDYAQPTDEEIFQELDQPIGGLNFTDFLENE